MNLKFYIHDLDPIAFRVGEFAFPWYWLVYFGGYFFFLFSMEYLVKKGKLKISLKQVYSYALSCFICLLLGGRLGYVLFYNLPYYIKFPEKLISFWEGGMSFHGALVACFLWTLYFCRREKVRFFHLSDQMCLLAPLVLFFGRIANFINGELAGPITSVPWAVVFPRLYDNNPRHPSQLYEALIEGPITFIILLLMSRKHKKEGITSAFFLICYGFGRYLVEFFRLPDKQLGLFFGLFSLGQIFCLLMVILGIGIILRPSRP